MTGFRKKFPFYKQMDAKDCGPTCIRMIAEYYGATISQEYLRKETEITQQGISMRSITDTGEKIGFKTLCLELSFQQLVEEAPLPCIAHFDKSHFVVITPGTNGKRISVADPGLGHVTYGRKEFLEHWAIESNTDSDPSGFVVLFEPTHNLYNQQEESSRTSGWQILSTYLSGHRKNLIQVMVSLLATSIIQLILPFLSQSVIDTGINSSDITFINIILVAQFALMLSRMLVDFIRTRLLMFISIHVNVSILAVFWKKLMKLPLSFHDSRSTGDILQRINDHHRIEQFVTGTTLNVAFSLLNLIVFSVVLVIYQIQVFLIFLLGSTFYFLWISAFLPKRRKLDHERFQVSAKENSATIQLIQGIHDIKLNNAEKFRRDEWQIIQNRVFKLSYNSLLLNQYQQTGALILNEGKNILITYMVARLVLSGDLSLGAMMAIQYIIAQLNSPIEQLIQFLQQLQDARLSLERLREVHEIKEEEPEGSPVSQTLPAEKDIRIRNLTFAYPGHSHSTVLHNLSFTIPEGKITAIVGMSGSGKTTLLKLLLKFYDGYKGDIHIHDLNIQHLSTRAWRASCGAVMQDGYIYNDSIKRNIATNEAHPDFHRLIAACKTANILSFVESLPMGFETPVGTGGVGLSQGQRQRILIARAIYKEPDFIFFDEATNSLDADNERLIINNLNQFFRHRTVVIVAHRLSTVANADNIIVLENGYIIEEGNHQELIHNKGRYYELVKNQLELGN